MIECNIQHRRSVTILCTLVMIRCNPMPLFMVPYLCRICASAGYTLLWSPPRFRTSRNHRSFISFSVSLWNDLADPVFDGVGLGGFTEQGVFYCFPFLFFLSVGCYCLAGVFGLIWCQSLCSGATSPTFLNNNNNNNNSNNNSGNGWETAVYIVWQLSHLNLYV